MGRSDGQNASVRFLGVADEEPKQRARDLVRRRRGTYRTPDTGRHHHLGAAPGRQPVLGDDGATYVETAPVQLASRTVAQLGEQRFRYESAMRRAAEDLDFEEAARLRDCVTAVSTELARRGNPPT